MFRCEYLDAALIARRYEGRQIHSGRVETSLLDCIAELLVEGRHVTTLIGPVGTWCVRPCGRSHLHPFLLHQAVVGALHLPVHTEGWRCLAGKGVVVQDRDVGVGAAARAVVVNHDHRWTVGPHLFRQQESQVTGALKVPWILDIQFVGMERNDVGMRLNSAAVLLGQQVAHLDERVDARCIAVKPWSQPVSPCRLMTLLLRPDAELQIGRPSAQVVDRRHRRDAHEHSFPLSTETMRA